MRGVDEARKSLGERRIVEPELRHESRAEILEHDVALADDPQRRGPSRGRVDVEDDALLVAVERAEEADAEAGQVACLVASRRLDLDHFGAQVREDHAAGRAHDHVRELDDAHSVEGKRLRGAVRHARALRIAARPTRVRLPTPARHAGVGAQRRSPPRSPSPWSSPPSRAWRACRAPAAPRRARG